MIDLSRMRNVTYGRRRANRERRTRCDLGPTIASGPLARRRTGSRSTGGLGTVVADASPSLADSVGFASSEVRAVACDLTSSHRRGDLVSGRRPPARQLGQTTRGLLGASWRRRQFRQGDTVWPSLHHVSTVIGGLMLFPLSRGKEVLTAFRDWAHDAPDEATMLAVIMTAPPEPFVPATLVGQKAVAIVGCWCGDPDAGEVTIEPLRRLGPSSDLFGLMPYPALQGMQRCCCWRRDFREDTCRISTTMLIDSTLDRRARMPSPMASISRLSPDGRRGRSRRGRRDSIQRPNRWYTYHFARPAG